MKSLFLIFLSFASIISHAQDTPITVNLSDNSKLQFNGNPVKMKATVNTFSPMFHYSKDWYIRVSVQYYESVAGAYGNYIPTTIAADGTLSADQKTELLSIYGDRDIEYTTVGQWCDASGNIVAPGTPGATTELAYWQSFKLNQIAGIGTLANTGALDAEYFTIIALINKLNTRKKW